MAQPSVMVHLRLSKADLAEVDREAKKEAKARRERPNRSGFIRFAVLEYIRAARILGMQPGAGHAEKD